MKTYSRLTLAFLLLILVVPQVGANESTDQEPDISFYLSGKKKSEELKSKIDAGEDIKCRKGIITKF